MINGSSLFPEKSKWKLWVRWEIKQMNKQANKQNPQKYKPKKPFLLLKPHIVKLPNTHANNIYK